MKQEDQAYFTITDVINTALSKPSNSSDKSASNQENDISLNVISDLTYSNIWNSFTKWCTDQTELGFYLIVFPFCEMFYVSEKPLEGIVLKLTSYFLKEHGLTWDANSPADKQYSIKYSNTEPQNQKLNYIAIARELNSKKILVQNGLNNIFNAIGYLISQNPNCQIDLGIIGSIVSSNKVVTQFPNKLKGDAVMNKKPTIKSLIGRAGKNIPSENSQGDSNVIVNSESQGNEKVTKEEKKEAIGKIKFPKNNKITFRFKPIRKPGEESKISDKPQLIDIPMPDSNWYLKDMLNATFKRVYIPNSYIGL